MPNTCVNYEKKCGGCPLLALPYRLGVFLHSAWLLAAYTQLKNRFL